MENNALPSVTCVKVWVARLAFQGNRCTFCKNRYFLGSRRSRSRRKQLVKIMIRKGQVLLMTTVWRYTVPRRVKGDPSYRDSTGLV